MRGERRREITDPTNSCVLIGLKWKNLMSSPLLERAKSICRDKSYLRFSLAEVIDDLVDEDNPDDPNIYTTPTSAIQPHVSIVYVRYLASVQPDLDIIDEDSSVSSAFISEGPDHFDPLNPTGGRLRTPSFSDSETGMSIISCSDIDQ